MLVRGGGLEPPHHCWRQDLNLVRLPISPPAHANSELGVTLYCNKGQSLLTQEKPLDTSKVHANPQAMAEGSSFYYAFLFLPPVKRQAITAFYGFCREIDDVVDQANEPMVAGAKLMWWRAEVSRVFAGEAAQHPALQALQPAIATHGLQARPFLDLIDGCEIDLNQTRMQDWAQLEQYCHLVAGVVGEVSAQIFGQSDPATTAYAHRLGLALQLTNILRDVAEDANRGRVYLPLSLLRNHGIDANEIVQGIEPAKLKPALIEVAARAHAAYEEALSMLPVSDWRAQKPGLMMASIYRQLLRRIQSKGYPVLSERVGLSPLHKLWLAWKVQALGRVS